MDFIQKGNIMNNIRVIAYENAVQGIYKYSLIRDPESETYELQKFIKSKKLDLNVKVDVRDITIPEKEMVGPTTCYEKEHEVIVILQGPKNGAIIFCGHPVISHALPSFLNWIVNWKGYNLNDISEMSFYTKGLTETLEMTPYAWGCDDGIACLAIEEK